MTPEAISSQIHAMLQNRHPGAQLDAELPLGAGGLALDSIAFVEVVLACEDAFGIALAAEMLEGPPLTVGSFIARIQALVAA